MPKKNTKRASPKKQRKVSSINKPRVSAKNKVKKKLIKKTKTCRCALIKCTCGCTKSRCICKPKCNC